MMTSSGKPGQRLIMSAKQEMCVICFENTTHQLQCCKQFIHQQCLFTWYKHAGHTGCPHCRSNRQPLTLEEESDFMFLHLPIRAPPPGFSWRRIRQEWQESR